MEIDTNSWHWRLANTYFVATLWNLEHYQYNFCQYSRLVLGGFLMVLIAIGLGVFVGLGWIQGIAALLNLIFSDGPFLWFINDANISGQFAIASIIIQGLILLAGILQLIEDRVKGWRARRSFTERDPVEKPAKEPGFLKTWYRAWKHKYCPLVTKKES